MTDARKMLIVDLAAKASRDAVEAVIRTAKLCATPDDGLVVLTIAMAMVEAKARTMRALIPCQVDTNELVDQLIEVETKSFAETVLRRAAQKSGGGAR